MGGFSKNGFVKWICCRRSQSGAIDDAGYCRISNTNGDLSKATCNVDGSFRLMWSLEERSRVGKLNKSP